MANTATSMYFDGTNDYVQFPDNTCDLGNTDFTIEMWINVVATETNAGLFTTNGTSAQPGFHIADTGSNTWKVVAGNAANWSVFDDAVVGTFTTGVWQHWAFVVTIGSDYQGHVRGFRNGELQAVVTSGTEAPFTLDSSGARLGHWTVGGQYINAYIDEFRISKVARYGNIEMPTTLVSSTQTAGRGKNALRPEHVSLLIQSNSTVTTSDSIVDRTGKNVVTASGTGGAPAYTQNFTQFGNCSIYFDGANQYHLEIPRSDLFDVSDGQDFSYECWFYRNATSAGNHAHFLSISADSSDGMYLAYRDTATPPDIQFL